MIKVRELSKEYKIVQRDAGLKGALKSLFKRKYITKEAVKGISFDISKGEMVGYIGANGAGKSTTIKMLCGILTPTNGTVLVNDIVPYEDRMNNALQIGAVFGQRTQLFWDIPVRESYDLLRHIYNIPKEQYEETLEMFTKVLNLSPLLSIPVRQLSLGQKMRCELAAAFLHRPDVVYLDEPTIGLDIAVKVRIREFIKEMNRKWGTTVILTTHDMQDIEEICSRVIIINEGIIIYDGDLQSIKSKFGHKRMIHFDLEYDIEPSLPKELNGIAQITSYDNETRKLTLSVESKDTPIASIISIMMNNHKVSDLTISEPKIETIVEEIFNRGL